MPNDLPTRRERRFRPMTYSLRHRLVAVLRGLGKNRQEIAAETGYSVSHVSRIALMPEALADSRRASSELIRTVTALQRAKLLVGHLGSSSSSDRT